MTRLLFAAIANLCLAVTASAGPIYTAGDSLCVGVSQVSGLPSAARGGAPAIEVRLQLRQIPKGTTVIVCAGTNDAAAGLYGFFVAVNLALAEAEKRDQKLIWVGPPKVRFAWDRYAETADTLLALTVPHFVSLRTVDWKQGERSPDGIHLTAAGTRRLLSIIRGR